MKWIMVKLYKLRGEHYLKRSDKILEKCYKYVNSDKVMFEKCMAQVMYYRDLYRIMVIKMEKIKYKDLA